MIERLTRELVEDGIPTITLYAEPQVRSFRGKVPGVGFCRGVYQEVGGSVGGASRGSSSGKRRGSEGQSNGTSS
jgi:hypothetical protein